MADHGCRCLADLAQKTGVKLQTLVNWANAGREEGRDGSRYRTLRENCDKLVVTVDHFLHGMLQE
jgi:hypothetical protein